MIKMEMFFVALAFESMETVKNFLLTQDLDIVTEKKLISADLEEGDDFEGIEDIFDGRYKYYLLCPMILVGATLVKGKIKGDAG